MARRDHSMYIFSRQWNSYSRVPGRCYHSFMTLPVLPSSSIVSAATLLRHYDRALLHWLRHYGDENDIGVGVAIVHPELPRIAETNTLLDAIVPAEASGEATMAQIDAAFGRLEASCARIVLNPDSAGTLPAEFSDLLLGRGYVKDTVQVLALGQAPGGLKQTYEGLTIIPARASFRHATQLAQEMIGGEAAQAAQSLQLHLDDSHYDALIALGDGKAVAFAGVLAAGEVGLLRQLYVSPQHRHRGIGTVMLARALDICQRSAFRHVMAGVAVGNEPLLHLLTRNGFSRIGQITVFRRPDDVMGEL